MVFVCEMAQGGGFIEAMGFGCGELPGFSESEVLFLKFMDGNEFFKFERIVFFGGKGGEVVLGFKKNR